MSSTSTDAGIASSDDASAAHPRPFAAFRRPPPVGPYALAVLWTGVAFALTLALPPLRDRASFLMMFGAVAISAVFGGLRAGVFAAILTSILFVEFFPVREFSLSRPHDLLRMVMFLLVSGVISVLAGKLREAQLETERLASEMADLAKREHAARVAAEAAIATRDDFISVAGHELRAPLAAMQLTSDLLRRQASRENLESFRAPLERLDLSLQRLTRLIGNVLDTSQLAVGKLTLDPEEFDLADLAAEAARRLADNAQRSGCALRVSGQAAPGRWDRTRIDQVITNLLSNAFKFGAGRPVELSTRSDGKDAYVIVRDEGVGVAPEDQSRIFERFERASSSRQYPGLGLGLWISQEIVRQHGGEISLESTPGRGSVFTVRLPV